MKLHIIVMDANYKREGEMVLPQDYEQDEADVIYTVDEGVDKMGFGVFQILIAVFSGLTWMAESTEIMLVSILSVAVKCQWDLSDYEEATITTIVFLGFFLGGLFWGVIFDTIGRKKGLLIVTIVISVFGILSSLQVSSDDSKIPGYPWLLACRFGVGFGASGVSQAVTYYAEFLPQKCRGANITLLELWFAAGSMFGAVLAIVVMSEGGLDWHWYLGLAVTPQILVLLTITLVPESARFYLAKGKDDKAQKVMARIAWFNCTQVPPGRVVSTEEKQRYQSLLNGELENKADNGIAKQAAGENSTELTPLATSDKRSENSQGYNKIKSIKEGLTNFTLLFTNGMWKTTILLVLLWMGGAWVYYGVVLLTTSLLEYDAHCSSDELTNMSNFTNESSSCSELDTSDYLEILWVSAAEIPGVVLAVVLIEVLGRKITMAVEFIGCMVGFLLLFICASDTLLTFFLFVIRAFATGAFMVVYVYTPEVYPTNVRALGIGVGTSSARIGAILTPYAAQVLIILNDYATISLYAGSSLVLAIVAMLLPIETKGRILHDTAN